MEQEDRTHAAEDEGRRRAIARIKRRRQFWALLLVYVVVNAFLIVVWAVSGGGYFWPAWVLGGWGIGVAVVAIDAYRPGWRGGDISEEEIRREQERRRGRRAA